MRITPDQASFITLKIKEFFGTKSQVWLFGSRTDDKKKGGDIDLYIQADVPDQELIASKTKFLASLYMTFGEQKVDVVLHQINKSVVLPIYDHAQKTGIKL